MPHHSFVVNTFTGWAMQPLGRILRYVCRVVFGLCAVGLLACQPNNTTGVLPLPRLPPGPITLRVAYVVNDRLPRMSGVQLAELLTSLGNTVQAHFGVELQFSAVTEIPIEDVFKGIPDAKRTLALDDIFDFKSGGGDVDRLKAKFTEQFAAQTEPLADRIAFAQPHAPALRGNASIQEFASAIADLQLQRLTQWRDLKAMDGGKAIDDKPYNEFTLWLALGYSDGLPFELVLTNQVIASAEYSYPSVHSAIRGGYTNGITTHNKQSRYGTMSVWSTFAFTDNGDYWVAMRNGERYAPMEAAQLAGASAAHEIGHQLFHLTHPFARPACVMSPVPMFAYREWRSRLSAADCRLGSDPSMTPGAYRFQY
ncbi:MAG: hypothetical protein V4858_15575 [Pseudomonadota bacterium]